MKAAFCFLTFLRDARPRVAAAGKGGRIGKTSPGRNPGIRAGLLRMGNYTRRRSSIGSAKVRTCGLFGEEGKNAANAVYQSFLAGLGNRRYRAKA
jgi:hypothetical protein